MFETLDRIVGNAPGRVIVATFASHLARVRQLLQLADKHGRKVAVAGRSMARNLEVARELDYIKYKDTDRIRVQEIDEYSKNKFTEAFRAINENFKQAFQTLFGGGSGQ